MNPIVSIKNGIQKRLKYIGGIAALIVYSVAEYLGDKRGRKMIQRVLVWQIYFTGNKALRVISIVAIALGVALMIPLYNLLSGLGAPDMVGQIMNIVVIRELGPLITAIIVISRSGTAIAAEIATMNINDEMNALEMQGIDTLKFIIYPRVMGMVFSLVLLQIYFTAVGLLGGFLVVNLLGDFTFKMFMRYIVSAVTFGDIFSSLIKGTLFGFFISTISVYHGFQATNSTQVPQVTTAAVMKSISATFVLDIIVTVMFYI